MDRIKSETRSFRIGLASFLSTAGWSVDYTEGWEEIDITNPMVNIYIVEPKGRTQLNLGDGADKLFERVVQVDVYMESEDRVRAINQDIADYMDQAAILIENITTTSGVGYMICPDSESIISDLFPPELNHPEILRWRGITRGDFESYYANGGNPI